MRSPVRATPTFSLRAYARLTSLLAPAVGMLARRRLGQGKEDPERIQERRGEATIARPKGRIVWLHGASVGEFLSIVPLVERLQARGVTVLVTTVTLTAARLAAKRLPPGALHQFMPWDVPRFIERFLDHWRPDLAIFAESELWPNLIIRTTNRGTPLIQVNGRMSERSFKGWKRVQGSIGFLLSRFELCLMQTVDDGRRVSDLGAPRVQTTGNLKFDVPAPAAEPAALAALSAAIGRRPVFLAASTHEGEDEIVLAAHKLMAPKLDNLLTIIAPRHPERGAAIAQLAEAEGLLAVQRSTGQLPARGTAVYVADTLGEMGLLYRVAPVALLGGSLIRHGGQNPIEPAKLGSAIVHGPHIFNFQAVYDALAERSATLEVADAESLATAALSLILDKDARTRQAEAAEAAVALLGGALDLTLGAIEPYFLALAMKGGS
ncbi:3-deoxy-D-manno-octulosonic acid transferase [Phreatobacter aquaticus]|uniref:3-deoxy-D-manno-octulosonic acid transferase n=1 Tax=Phreatobacter aquaticus TaxID=2570229 RepID=A0A4D7QFN2_9HYPH|nr:3-deoxy-D-manno-octulosonic acid transferase [Phreatobacter aquaticus]QCK85471.1 3-deoxy-D-manno-octulosonic acid transferase [Phreatobacter aquaticus]